MAERATQVKLMGRIYKEAYGVLAWLGEESGMVAHARPAFALMKAFAGAVREVARMVGGEVGEEEVLARAQMEDLLIVAVVFSAAVEELVRQGVSVDGSQKAMVEVFFTNAYWKRCWTFQEMYLADYGTLLCGMQTLSMQDAWTVHKWFRQAGRAILANARPEGVSDQAWWILQDMEDVLGGLPLFSSMRIKETVASGGNGFAAYFRDSEDLFATLLLTSLEREATYPRDRFYSLMGVCKPAINIDYVAPDEDVFVEVTAAPLRGGRISASFVLEFAGFTAPKGAYALSSWVPNWDISLLKSSPDSGRAHNLTDADAGFPGPRFRPVINGLTARFQGTFIDSIARVQAGWDGIPTGCILDESAPPTLDIARHLLDEMAKFFFDCPPGAFMLELVPSSKPYAGGGTRFLALLRYWTHDMKLYRKPFECVITRDLNSEDVVRLAKQFLMFVGLRPWDMDRIMALGRPAGEQD
ncbi:hypothetical protein N0V88_008125 [Collariella sp. IMI 366227]|nr:hypothetical protein N0V88_008125 [Collariella sp. IMI 366227]